MVFMDPPVTRSMVPNTPQMQKIVRFQQRLTQACAHGNDHFYLFRRADGVVQGHVQEKGKKKEREDNKEKEDKKEDKKEKEDLAPFLVLEYEARLCPRQTWENHWASLRSQERVPTLIHAYSHLLQSLELLDRLSVSLMGGVNDWSQLNMHPHHDVPVLTQLDHLLDLPASQLEDTWVGNYEPTRGEWPLERHMQCYLKQHSLDSLSLFNVEQVVHDWANNNDNTRQTGNKKGNEEAENDKKEEAKRRKACEDTWGHSFRFCSTQEVRTWDSYALHASLLRWLRANTRFAEFASHPWGQRWVSIAQEAMALRPRERASLRATCSAFEQLTNDLVEPQNRNLLPSFEAAFVV